MQGKVIGKHHLDSGYVVEGAIGLGKWIAFTGQYDSCHLRGKEQAESETNDVAEAPGAAGQDEVNDLSTKAHEEARRERQDLQD